MLPRANGRFARRDQSSVDRRTKTPLTLGGFPDDASCARAAAKLLSRSNPAARLQRPANESKANSGTLHRAKHSGVAVAIRTSEPRACAILILALRPRPTSDVRGKDESDGHWRASGIVKLTFKKLAIYPGAHPSIP